jgi:hypothetical protein
MPASFVSLSFELILTNTCILKARSQSHSKSGRFNMSFPLVSMLFLNSWRVSSHIVRYDTNPPAIQKTDSIDTQGKLRLNLHSLSVSELFLEYRRCKSDLHCKSDLQTGHCKSDIGHCESNLQTGKK